MGTLLRISSSPLLLLVLPAASSSAYSSTAFLLSSSWAATDAWAGGEAMGATSIATDSSAADMEARIVPARPSRCVADAADGRLAPISRRLALELAALQGCAPDDDAHGTDDANRLAARAGPLQHRLQAALDPVRAAPCLQIMAIWPGCGLMRVLNSGCSFLHSDPSHLQSTPEIQLV